MRPSFDAFDDSHGRLVRRRVFACPDVSVFAALRDWPNLAAVLAVETIRGVNGTGKITAEIRHFVSSAQVPPETLAIAIRRRWCVENGLHWVLDVGFREDLSRLRKGHGAENMAIVRHFALNLVRCADDKRSLKRRRKCAGWHTAYLESLLGLPAR